MARHPQHEAELNEKTLVCRGPTILADFAQQSALATVYAVAERGDRSEVVGLAEAVRLELARICRMQTDDEKTPAIERNWAAPASVRPDRDPVEEAIRIIGAHSESCGCVLNDVILDAGADGLEHSAPCPRCGNVFTWRAPRFE